MSGRKVIKVVATLIVTGLLCLGAWTLWNEVPGWLRGTEFADFGFLASLLAVFLGLSLINPVLGWLWNRITGDHDQH